MLTNMLMIASLVVKIISAKVNKDE